MLRSSHQESNTAIDSVAAHQLKRVLRMTTKFKIMARTQRERGIKRINSAKKREERYAKELRPESYDPKYISIEDHGGVSTTQLSITRKPRNKEIEFLVKTSYRHNFRSRRLSKGGRPLSMGGERSKSLSHYQEMCRKLKRSMELKYKNLDNIEREINPRRRKEGFLTDEAFTKAGTKLNLKNGIFKEVDLPQGSYIKAKISCIGNHFPMRFTCRDPAASIRVLVSYNRLPSSASFDLSFNSPSFQVPAQSSSTFTASLGLMIIALTSLEAKIGCTFSRTENGNMPQFPVPRFKQRVGMSHIIAKGIDYDRLLDMRDIKISKKGREKFWGRSRQLVLKNVLEVTQRGYPEQRRQIRIQSFQREKQKIKKAKIKRKELARSRMDDLLSRKSRNEVCRLRRLEEAKMFAEGLILLQVVEHWAKFLRIYSTVTFLREEVRRRARAWESAKRITTIGVVFRKFWIPLKRGKRSAEAGALLRSSVAFHLWYSHNEYYAYKRARRALGIFLRAIALVWKTRFLLANYILNINRMKNRFKAHMKIVRYCKMKFNDVLDWEMNQILEDQKALLQVDTGFEVKSKLDKFTKEVRDKLFHIIFNEKLIAFLWHRITKKILKNRGDSKNEGNYVDSDSEKSLLGVQLDSPQSFLQNFVKAKQEKIMAKRRSQVYTYKRTDSFSPRKTTKNRGSRVGDLVMDNMTSNRLRFDSMNQSGLQTSQIAPKKALKKSRQSQLRKRHTVLFPVPSMLSSPSNSAIHPHDEMLKDYERSKLKLILRRTLRVQQRLDADKIDPGGIKKLRFKAEDSVHYSSVDVEMSDGRVVRLQKCPLSLKAINKFSRTREILDLETDFKAVIRKARHFHKERLVQEVEKVKLMNRRTKRKRRRAKKDGSGNKKDGNADKDRRSLTANPAKKSIKKKTKGSKKMPKINVFSVGDFRKRREARDSVRRASVAKSFVSQLVKDLDEKYSWRTKFSFEFESSHARCLILAFFHTQYQMEGECRFSPNVSGLKESEVSPRPRERSITKTAGGSGSPVSGKSRFQRFSSNFKKK